MPLVIPAPRNIRREMVRDLVTQLQHERIARETREHQEGLAREARDKQLTGLSVGLAGGIVGGIVAGPALAKAGLVSAGAKGALASAIGGGSIGARIGSQIGGGDVAGGVVNALSSTAKIIEAQQNQQLNEAEKNSRFLEWGIEQFGSSFPKQWERFKSEAQSSSGSPLSNQRMRNRFLEQHADRLQSAFAREQEQAQIMRHRAKFQAKQDQQFMRAARGGVETLSAQYQLSPIQENALGELIAERENLELAFNEADNIDEQDEVLNQLASNRTKLVRMGRRLLPKPSPPISVQQALSTGGEMPIGRLLTVGDPKTATEARVFTGRSVVEVPLKTSRGMVESEKAPGTFMWVDDNGKASFAGKTIGGKFVPMGEPFDHPSQGRGYYDPDGVFQPYKTKDDFGIDVSETADEVFKAFSDRISEARPEEMDGVLSSMQQTTESVVRAKLESRRTAQRIMEQEAFNRSLRKAGSGQEAFKIIAERDRTFREDLKIISNADRHVVDQVEESARRMALTVFNIRQNADLSPAVQAQLDRQMQMVIEVLRERQQSPFRIRESNAP